jgi:hypothetical protein
MTRQVWLEMNKLKTHLVAKILSLVEVIHLAKGGLMDSRSNSSKDKVLEIYSKSLRRCLEVKADQNGEMFRQKDKMF